jgi:hypothetical protein
MMNASKELMTQHETLPMFVDAFVDISNLLPFQNEREIIERAFSTSKSLHLQIPQLLFSNLQQWLYKVWLSERDVQKDAVGLENAVDLPLHQKGVRLLAKGNRQMYEAQPTSRI